MAVMVIIEWPDVTPGQYDQVLQLVKWDVEPPVGAIYQVAAFDGKGLRVTDVYESPEHFQNFVDDRLMPGVQRIGIQGAPKVEVYPTHTIFAPGYNPR